jgi:DNA-binding protein
MVEETTKKETVKEKRDENTIFVGSKPPMSYVLAVVTQFNTTKSEEVVLKARGRAISRAVDEQKSKWIERLWCNTNKQVL